MLQGLGSLKYFRAPIPYTLKNFALWEWGLISEIIGETHASSPMEAALLKL